MLFFLYNQNRQQCSCYSSLFFKTFEIFFAGFCLAFRKKNVFIVD